jgi:ribosomal protein L7Ae-like RNA K-turn-binding protein
MNTTIIIPKALLPSIALQRRLIGTSLISSGSNILFSRQAHLAVLAESCYSEPYNKLIEALRAEHNIKVIKIADRKKLGEWTGFCILDCEGNARKVVGASCIVVKDYGKSLKPCRYCSIISNHIEIVALREYKYPRIGQMNRIRDSYYKDLHL